MLLHITQIHTPELCPADEGGLKMLYDPNVEGIKLRAVYGALAAHVIYYIVEADSLEAVYKLLDPGWTRCTCKITPVSERPIVR